MNIFSLIMMLGVSNWALIRIDSSHILYVIFKGIQSTENTLFTLSVRANGVDSDQMHGSTLFANHSAAFTHNNSQ